MSDNRITHREIATKIIDTDPFTSLLLNLGDVNVKCLQTREIAKNLKELGFQNTKIVLDGKCYVLI